MRYVVVILLLASPALAGEPVYSWRSLADDPGRVYLFRDGEQIGGWCYRAKHYRSFDGKNWGPPTDAAPVRPPVQRMVVTPQQRPMVTQPSLVYLPLRGPLRARLGTAVAQAMVDITMKAIEEIPGAIADSVAKGQYQLDFKFSVTPSPQKSDGQTTPPSPGQPARSP
jgi:hypothetical protein